MPAMVELRVKTLEGRVLHFDMVLEHTAILDASDDYDLIDGDLTKHEYDFSKPEEIARITASISKTRALILRNHRPQTGLEGKFSMEFAMAAAVIARRASLAEFTDGFVRRPDVQALMRRVEIEAHENYDPEVSGAVVFDQVRVELNSGETIAGDEVRRARGAAEFPLGEAELFDKFRTCLDAGHARIAPEHLFDRLRNLENISARELTAVG
jgi:2-methylcitrate dehydratase PrpD